MLPSLANLSQIFVRKIKRSSAISMIKRADAYRDHRDWLTAAPIYLASHKKLPWRNDLLIQAAHCYKELGIFGTAVQLYRQASLDPEQSTEAGRQIEHVDDLAKSAWNRVRMNGIASSDTSSDETGVLPSLQRSFTDDGSMRPIAVLGQLAPSSPGPTSVPAKWSEQSYLSDSIIDPFTDEPLSYQPGIFIIQAGNFSLEQIDGIDPLLAGVVAIRVKVISYCEIHSVSLSHSSHSQVDYPLARIREFDDGRLLYIANIWVDTQCFQPGTGLLELHANPLGTVPSASLRVNIVRLPELFSLPRSDAFVSSPEHPYVDIVDEIKERRAVVRQTADLTETNTINSILLIRIDQLGDLAASLPAMRRLREALPNVHLVALVATELVGIVEASGVVNEVLGLSTVYDPVSGRRYLLEAERQSLQSRMAERLFEVAIDLCPGEDSRHLLTLVNAQERVGFLPNRFNFLDFGLEIVSRDKANPHSTQSHAALIMSLVEAFLLKRSPLVGPVVRQVASNKALTALGLSPKNYIVMHCGARHSINRWPQANFVKLAKLLTDSLNLSVVLFLEDLGANAELALLADPRLITLGKIPIDDFDQIITNAYIMIGNDSGPKHLASVRGVWTASIHINRLNWNEWGQNGPGIVISKKVPCAACALNDERLCGQEVACLRSITVDEVFEAVLKAMPSVDHKSQGYPH